uniref:DZIP3-like HEPN domain-containing protein n=1 Tax=Panagrolaimus davidi TaxID=227884 RepID=A0A914R0R1_9BILA
MDIDHQERLLNRFRIDQILARGGSQLQKVFKERWKKWKDEEWKDSNAAELVELCEKAGPKAKEKIKNDKIDLWDITATCWAIQAISSAIPTNKTETKAIYELREARNNMAHEAELTNEEFNQKWNHISNMLVKLGDNYANIKALKTELLKIGKSGVVASNVEPIAKSDINKESDNDRNDNGLENDLSDFGLDNENGAKENETQKEKLTCVEDGRCDKCDSKAEYNKLKDEANKFFKEENFDKAIEVYSKILQLPGILPEDKAVIFSYRSIAHLSLKNGDSAKMAQKDAEWAIQLWPCGWRGYYHLARAQIALENYFEAEKSLNNAIALNPSSKEVRDELSAVRSKIGILSRCEHLNSAYQFPSEKEQLDQIHTRTGMSKKQTKKLLNKAMDIPVFGDMIRGKNYMLGKGVEQDYTKAAYHFEKAASGGDPDAMYCLGLMYHEGKGIPQDFTKSMELLLKAANTVTNNVLIGSGIPEAQHLLGMKYSEGIGVAKDYRKAAEWYEKAVNHGLGSSANNLGIFYKNGQGVEKSSKKAFEYFKLAASLGEAQGMQNLAHCYLLAEGTDLTKPSDEYHAEGLKWLKLSLEKGNMNAANDIERFKDKNKDDLKWISLINKVLSQTSTNTDVLDKEQHGTAIKESAKKGSTTAQRHLNIWENIELAMEAFKKNDSAGVVSGLATSIRLDHEITEVPEILFSVIDERMKTHADDLDTITCFIHTKRKKNNLLYLNAIDEYLPKFPKDEYLLEQRITSFIDSKSLKDALITVDKALEFYPNSLRFLYLRAIALCTQDKQQEETLKALNNFLSAAPTDHDKVPACYYQKAIYYNNINNIPKFIEAFEAGLAAEKKQLPCFLPYKFHDKIYLEKIFENHKTEKASKNDSSKIPSTSSEQTLEKIKLNRQRKFLIDKHRQNFIDIEENLNSHKGTAFTGTSVKPPNTPKPPRLSSLKNITLKEMNPIEDKPYDGYVLEVRIIDWAYVVSGIAGIIEDENGDLQRLAIYNWPSKGNRMLDTAEALKSFRPNSVISIINPYMRMSRDMQSMIRVESPGYMLIGKSYCNGLL